jgi:PAS domain S-box-containing protein
MRGGGNNALLAGINRGFWVGMIAIVAIILTSVGMVLKIQNVNAWGRHSREVSRVGRVVRSGMIERDTSIRRFAESRDSVFLQRALAVRPVVAAATDSLVRLTADNPPQLARATVIREEVGRWERDVAIPALASLARTPAFTRTGDPPSRTQFDRVSAAVDSLLVAEAAVYAARGRTEEAIVLIALASIVGELILSALALIWLRRRMSRQAEQLIEQQEQLEDQAIEMETQTAELEEQARSAEEAAAELEVINAELRGTVKALEETQAEKARAVEKHDAADRLLSTVLESAPAGFALFDRDGRYQRINHKLASIDEMPIEEHIGRTVREVFPQRADFVESTIEQVIATAAPVTEIEIVDPRGPTATRRTYLASFYPVHTNGSGTVNGVGMMVIETTDRKQLEQQLLQAQKMEAVGRLAGGVAHDFNNLLTVISSYADLLLDDFEPDDYRRADLEEIRGATVRASGLTRQLLAFSRKQVLQPVPLSLNSVVEGIDKMLARLIGEDINLTTVLASNLGTVNADPGQIEQVIMNLVVNSRDAMPNGGRITIETANVELSSEDVGRRLSVAPGPHVMLAVTDTGHGMGSDVLPHLFEPFFTTKGTGQGTGLGLSTVFGIVRQSGGDVWVYSEVGQGTTFKIYLPLTNPVSLRVSTPKAAGPTERGTETILVAEDDDALRALILRVLTGNGYSVLEARNGRAALELCTTHKGRIDLVLSDVIMPELGGRALVERLDRSQPDARVIFMSGYTDDDVFRRALIDHQTDFLQKPFTPDMLLRRVRDVLAAPRRAR